MMRAQGLAFISVLSSSVKCYFVEGCQFMEKCAHSLAISPTGWVTGPSVLR